MSKEVKISNSKDVNNTQKICCCNCCQSCNCCECCTSCQCCNCNNCCECECFWRAFALILITLILFYLDLFTLIIRLIAAVCFGCELFPFSRLFLNKCVGFQLPILGCYCCVLYSFCCDDSLKSGSSSGNSYSIGKPNRILKMEMGVLIIKEAIQKAMKKKIGIMNQIMLIKCQVEEMELEIQHMKDIIKIMHMKCQKSIMLMAFLFMNRQVKIFMK